MNLIRLSIERPVFISMVTLFFVVIGGLALRTLPVDLYPDVSYPVLAVRAGLSGAAPEEMEQIVTKPLEDSLSSLAGLVNMRSISRVGMSMVILEFESGIDIKFQETQVRAKVANMRRYLPDDLSEPVVYRQDPDDVPIIELSITGNRTASELGQVVEDQIAERIRQIPGVGEVEIGGERRREIIVALKPEALEAFKISSNTIIQAIRDFNGNEPIGNLTGERSVWLLRSTSYLKGVDDLRNVPVMRSASGAPVLLRDIADITSGFAEMTRINRLSTKDSMRPAISVDVLKQSGENTVQVSDDVLKLLEELRQELPNDIFISVTRDNAELVRTNVADVTETLIIGAFLTIMVVLLFLRSPRATAITGISLPTSIITTFAIMAVAGFTINIMTLLALSLAVGLLVDDAIVVRENIFRHMRKNPIPAEAAYNGTMEVSLAVIATTLTVVAVFLPVGFMGGTTGQFFKQFAVTVVFAMSISLWDALTMAPMLSTYFANISDPTREWLSFGRVGRKINRFLIRFEHLFNYLEASYRRMLGWLLPRRWVAMSVASAVAITTVFGFNIVGKSFLPAQLGEVFSISLTGPLAVATDQITQAADLVDKRLKKLEVLDNWTIRGGGGFSGRASISLTIRVKKEHGKNQKELAQVRTDVRNALNGIVGYNVRISEPSDPLAGGGGRFQPVAVLISGPELATLRELAVDVQGLLGEIHGITDVSQLSDEGLPELELQTSMKLAGHFGVTPKAIGSELRTWIEGDTSNKLQVGDDRIPIRVRLKDSEHLTLSDIMAKSVFARSATGGETITVPISNTVTVEAGAGPSVIARENRQKILRVGANTVRGVALGGIVNDLEKRLKALPLPDGYRVRVVGQNEQMAELFRSIIIALALGCLFMYMILASLFESYTHPLTVMAAVPLAATGAVYALLLFDLPLDLYGGIGMILLAGIMAKNSILLVDFAMQKVRNEGLDPIEAVLASAPVRLRPILMTSIAMIAGMMPVATGLGVGGAARQALGIAVIGGIISSTFLTLVIVPNLYIAVEGFVRRMRRFRNRDVGAVSTTK